MYDLPLFPLNTVLFPGMPLALHIFEDRYKLMIGQCIQERRPFGVVLIRQGAEALGPLAQPHSVGCSAQITQVQRLEQGRMNIAAIGRERFRIVQIQRDLPYLKGRVEPFPLANEAGEAGLAQAGRRLQPWLRRYMTELSQVEGVSMGTEKVPDDPVQMAYLAAGLLQISTEEKQRLLATEQAIDLLTEMRNLYRREVALVRALLDEPAEDQGIFSVN